MGRKLTANGRAERKNRNNQKREDSFHLFLREEAVEIYLVIMLAVYPLFMGDGYVDLVYRKWKLLLYASVLFILGSMAAGIPVWVSDIRERRKPDISALDKAVLIYFVCVLISYVGAADRKAAFYGVPTWYMGLVAQLLFVGIYFAVSRGYVRIKYLEYMAAAVFMAVCGIVVLQRFGVNVLSLYTGLPEEVKLNFVGTMGQVTWSSSYISILLIVGIGIYYMAKKGAKKVFFGICVGIGFATEAVLNCDSGIIALACAMTLLLWLSLSEKGRIRSFMEIVIIALASLCGMGAVERSLSGRMVPIDGIYLKIAQNTMTAVLLLAVTVIYLILQKRGFLEENAVNGKGMRTARCICAGLLVLALLLVAALFILHGKGYFAGSPTENYFRFTVWWGNSRGFIWRTGAAVFGDFSIWRKLFGCGPDGFTTYAYRLMGDAINRFWSNQTVPNAHNEWFNAVINYGLVGGTAYLLVFVISAKRFLSEGLAAAGKRPELLGLGLAAAGYIAHNFLCYQQMIGTPLIFLLMGLGEALRRERTAG